MFVTSSTPFGVGCCHKMSVWSTDSRWSWSILPLQLSLQRETDGRPLLWAQLSLQLLQALVLSHAPPPLVLLCHLTCSPLRLGQRGDVPHFAYLQLNWIHFSVGSSQWSVPLCCEKRVPPNPQVLIIRAFLSSCTEQMKRFVTLIY